MTPFGKGRSVYFVLAGKAVTSVQSVGKSTDRGSPGANSQVSDGRGVAVFLIGCRNEIVTK